MKNIQLKIIYHFTDLRYNNKKKTYCVKCRKDTENINPTIVKTKNGRLLMESKYIICRIKKSKFMKEPEAKGDR